MALPDGHEEKTQEEWLTLARSGDAAERKQVSNCLRSLGFDPPMFLTWKAEQRVEQIMKQQEESSGGGKKKKGAAKSKKPKTSSTKGKESTQSSSGETVDLQPIMDELRNLAAQITELTEANDILMDYIRETHTMMRVFFQSDEEAKNNLEEVGNFFHGKLLGLEEEESDGDD